MSRSRLTFGLVVGERKTFGASVALGAAAAPDASTAAGDGSVATGRCGPVAARVASWRPAPGEDTAAAKRCAAQSNKRGCDWVPFRNVMETIGLAKPDQVIAGQEPDRDWLTDPPRGYRLPTTDTVATTEVKPKVNDADPRTALYHPPEN